MSKRRERIAAIIQTLQVQNAATIQELAGQLGVSDMTIRRDLNLLAQDNIIRLVHSGAILNPGSLGSYQPRYSLAEAGTLRVEAKMAIGRKAASLIEDGDIVVIGQGIPMAASWKISSLLNTSGRDTPRLAAWMYWQPDWT